MIPEIGEPLRHILWVHRARHEQPRSCQTKHLHSEGHGQRSEYANIGRNSFKCCMHPPMNWCIHCPDTNKNAARFPNIFSTFVLYVVTNYSLFI